MSIRILLADDHKLVRQGLCSLIEQESDFEVVAQVENGRDAVLAALEYRPDVAILDVKMPDLNGIDAAKKILEAEPEIKILALSFYTTRNFVTGMLKAGASGYLAKDCAFQELITAVRWVVKGQSYLSPQIHDIVVKDYIIHAPENFNEIAILSDREREVLQLISEGFKSERIAEKLFISTKTVSTHRQKIMKKLHLNGVAELTKFAIKQGLTSIDD